MDNWTLLQKEYHHKIGSPYVEDRTQKVWTFFGLVDGADDYYYGMSCEGKTVLLSCAGDIESFGFTPAPVAGEGSVC